MQPSSLRSLRLCGESKVARGRCRACVQSAGSPASGRQPRYHPLARMYPRAGAALDFYAEAQRGPGGCSRLTALSSPLFPNTTRFRPAGSYEPTGANDVGARLRATQRTARKRRACPERPLIHRRGAENAEKRLHPPWPLCALCASALNPTRRPQAGSYEPTGADDVGARLRATQRTARKRRISPSDL
jgi:hypothetical protein